MEDKHHRKKRDAMKKNPALLHDPATTDDANDLTDLYMTRFEEREELLEKMHDLTKSMMQSKQKHSVKVQTESAVWNNTNTYRYVDVEDSKDNSSENFFTKTEEDVDATRESKVKILMK